MNARVPTLLRRGACPGLSAPMPTGDGLLVRLVPADSISPDAFIALCAAARAHGNGTMEVTARGSLQVRGLTPASAPPFASEVARLDIAAADGVAVLAGPLRDDAEAIIEASGLAGELRQAIAHAHLALAPKVSVVLDGGGRLHLDALTADVRLRAIGPAATSRLLVALGAPSPQGSGGSSVWLGVIAPERAVDVVLGLLREIAALGPAARAEDVIRVGDIDAIRSRFAMESAAVPVPRPPAEMVGRHALRDRSLALGIALAFGHARADTLAELVRRAAAHGARSIRPAPDRALMLIGIPPGEASALAAAAEQIGFVVSAGDPRRRIAACPGAPACASGFIDARRLAAELAPRLAGLRDGIAVHVSGCAKGCAHKAPAALTVIGTAHGCGIVRNGTARAMPRYHVAPGELAAEMARAFPDGEAELVFSHGEAVDG
jgi:precorrin-3B synthase